MRKVYLEGQLGEKFGAEWNLAVNSPAEALSAIMAQRPGMRQYLASAEGVQGYEVLVDNESIDTQEELVLQNPSMKQSYTFVPVIGGSKSSGLMMVLGVTLLAATGGLAGFGISGFMTGSASLVGAEAAALTAVELAAVGGTGAIGAGGLTAAQALAASQAAGIAAGGAAKAAVVERRGEP